jgi:hypothetical protein
MLNEHNCLKHACCSIYAHAMARSRIMSIIFTVKVLDWGQTRHAMQIFQRGC